MTTISFHIWALLSFLITSTFVGAYDITQKLQPLGNLQVQLDYSLVLASGQRGPAQQGTAKQDVRNIVYTSYIKFKEDVSSITNPQLYTIVRDGFLEVDAERGQYGFNAAQGKPTVMSIIAVGNYVLIASNQKGQTSYTLSLPDSPVARSLQMCQMVFASERGIPPTDPACTSAGASCRHANGYNCGEIMAAHLWFRLNHASTTMNGLNGRILAVWSDASGNIVSKDPCGGDVPNTWGCNRFAIDQGLTVIQQADCYEAAYDITTIAGGFSERGQVQLCS